MKRLKRTSHVLLSLMLLVGFLCLGGIKAHAGGGYDLSGIVHGDVNTGGSITVGNTVYVTMQSLKDIFGNDFETLYNSGDVYCEWVISEGDNPGTSVKATLISGKFSYTAQASDAGKKLRFYTCSKDNQDTSYNNSTEEYPIKAKTEAKAYIDVKGSMTADGKITVVGDAGDKKFNYLKIVDNPTGKEADRKVVDSWYIGAKTFSKTIDAKEYDVGYHEIWASFLEGGEEISYSKVFPTNIYDKPDIKRNSNFFSTGSNYICYRPYFTIPPMYDSVYVQFYNGGKWGGVYGPFSSYTIMKTAYFTGDAKKGGTKIKADTSYTARTFFAKKVRYGGSYYYMVGPYSDTVSVKTGKGKKLSIKSVSAKCILQKKVKLTGGGYWDAGGVWHPPVTSYTWTTKYKVTVKLKKKPGTKGIYIGNKKVKGNKKTYTATFTDSGKLKGKKIKISFCSYNDAALNAFSPTVTKKVKVK